MKVIGNFEINEILVEESDALLEVRPEAKTDEERNKQNDAFRKDLLNAAVKYRHPESQELLPYRKAPLREVMENMGELFSAALEINGFR